MTVKEFENTGEGGQNVSLSLIWRLPGLASVRGRFLYLAAGLLLYLVLAGLLADSYTSHAVDQAAEKFYQNQQAENATGRILFSAWQLESLLEEAAANPDKGDQERLRGLVFDIFTSVRNLHPEKLATLPRVPALMESLIRSVEALQMSIRPVLEGAAPGLDVVHVPLAEIREQGFALQRALQVARASSIANLHTASGKLKNFLWGLVLGGLALLILAYLLLARFVLRPMAEFQRLLDSDVMADGAALPVASTLETRRLRASLQKLSREVEDRQSRLRTVLDNTAEAIITMDDKGVIESFNKAAQGLFDLEAELAIGSNVNMLLPEHLREYHAALMGTGRHREIDRIIGRERELVAQRKGGRVFPVSVKITEVMIDGARKYIALVADISERKAIIDHLRFVAERDALTGLHNRAYFQQEMQKAVEKVGAGRGQRFAVLYIDLDNFKYVNDTLGHAAGDRMIMEVVKLLKQRLRKHELLARFGGDEFTILLNEVNEETARSTAESYRNALENRILIHEGRQNYIRCSVGVAMAEADLSAHEILSRADLACHLAKREGRNRVHVFVASDARDLTAMSVDMGWSRRIKEAIERDRLVLASQPIVDTRSNEVFTYEVLVRMFDDEGGLILPGGFMPAAERFGQASDIDRWVIVNAIDKLLQLQQQLPQARFTINLSGQTLSQSTVVELIRGQLEKTGLPPSSLIFEVTETVAIADMAAARDILSAVQDMGCRTALDDFGSGMSSFAYLKDLPVDIVKIDGRFVRNLSSNPVDQAMVKAMKEVAHALGKQVVAEFVEDEASYRLLGEFGVDFAQGYHLGRPQLLHDDSAPHKVS